MHGKKYILGTSGTPVRKRSIERSRLRWVDQVMKDVKQIVQDAKWSLSHEQREMA